MRWQVSSHYPGPLRYQTFRSLFSNRWMPSPDRWTSTAVQLGCVYLAHVGQMQRQKSTPYRFFLPRIGRHDPRELSPSASILRWPPGSRYRRKHVTDEGALKTRPYGTFSHLTSIFDDPSPLSHVSRTVGAWTSYLSPARVQ
ncbi:hypothetical protein BDW22DRAFT_1160009 [Trametopsis cervina]|nr:hypothetical protein BDW22DRAFT_1160009 [Trametopsis cervina]